LRDPPQSSLLTSLDLGPDVTDLGIQIAAEIQECGNGENCDQRKDECVLRETLAFLAVKEQEQERPPFTRTAWRLRTLAGWNPGLSGDLRVVGGVDAHPKITQEGRAWVGLPSFTPLGDERMASPATLWLGACSRGRDR